MVQSIHLSKSEPKNVLILYRRSCAVHEIHPELRILIINNNYYYSCFLTNHNIINCQVYIVNNGKF